VHYRPENVSRKFHNKSWLLAAKPPKAVAVVVLGGEIQFRQQEQEQQTLEQLVHRKKLNEIIECCSKKSITFFIRESL